MDDGWRTVRLGSVCTKIGSGATPRGGKDVYLEDGPYTLIRSQNVYNRGFSHNGLAFIGEGHAKKLKNVEVVSHDVLLNITGDSVARVCQVDSAVLPARVNQHVAIIRPDHQKLDPRFLRYWLATPTAQALLLSLAGSGGTRKALTKRMIELLEVPVPPIRVQHNIAHILGTLDDKIELNRRISETLEQTARALFKSWFVDFDPVRAKMKGRWRPSVSLPGLPATLYDLFPDRLVDSRIGPIPEGWKVGTLGDVADEYRKNIRPTQIDTTLPYLTLAHMPRRSISLAEWATAGGIASNKFAFEKGDILFGKLRPYFHKVGVAPVSGVCSTDIVVLRPRSSIWFGFVLGHTSSTEFVNYTDAAATGTRMPRTSWKTMEHYDLVKPPNTVAQAFSEAVVPMIDRIASCIHNCRAFTALRDNVLPWLIK